MARHEYDYPMTSKGIALKGFVSGSLFFAAFFFPNPAVQLVSFILAAFMAFACCMPFDEYFYFCTVILSGIVGAIFAFISSLFNLLLFYWILIVLAFCLLAYRRSFLRWKRK